jgi:hypothetical protein
VQSAALGGGGEGGGGPPLEESFGDIALRLDLQAALGAMTMFLGAYGRVWEVANRLKGADADPKADRRRQQSRLLWEAMLRGDFAYAKRLYDEEQVPRVLVDSPPDCVLLAACCDGSYTARAAARSCAARRPPRPFRERHRSPSRTRRDRCPQRGRVAALHRLAVEASSPSRATPRWRRCTGPTALRITTARGRRRTPSSRAEAIRRNAAGGARLSRRRRPVTHLRGCEGLARGGMPRCAVESWRERAAARVAGRRRAQSHSGPFATVAAAREHSSSPQRTDAGGPTGGGVGRCGSRRCGACARSILMVSI